MAEKLVKICDVCGMVLNKYDERHADGRDYCSRCYQYTHQSNDAYKLSIDSVGKIDTNLIL